jgi:hypothetical protein
MNTLIINQDVLLRTPITQVRRHIDDGSPEDTARQLRTRNYGCIRQHRPVNIIHLPSLGLPSGLFPSGFSTNIPHAFLFPTRATCPAYLILFDLIILIILDDEHKYHTYTYYCRKPQFNVILRYTIKFSSGILPANLATKFTWIHFSSPSCLQ